MEGSTQLEGSPNNSNKAITPQSQPLQQSCRESAFIALVLGASITVDARRTTLSPIDLADNSTCRLLNAITTANMAGSKARFRDQETRSLNSSQAP